MLKNIRMLLALAVYVICFAIAIYIGGWVLLFDPLKKALVSYAMKNLTLKQLLVTAMKCMCSLTVTGFIWCIGYISSNYIYDSRDEQQAMD